MSEHTKGPLEVGYYTPSPEFVRIPEHVAVMKPDGALIAVTGPLGCPTSEADARLYAAAPDLLDACEKALDDLDTWHTESTRRPFPDSAGDVRYSGCDGCHTCTVTIPALRDAIERARGTEGGTTNG